jgi:MoaA/NifB/PqqE/SkfB family radical SAM enzyme
VSSERDPETLHLEVTNRCNFECEVCIRRTWSAKRTDLNIDIYNKIAESAFPLLRRLVICGFGEPFANSNLVSMLRTSKEKLPSESEVILTTNGSLLSPTISDKLVGRGLLSELSFSIDTVDVAKLSRIRKGARLETILNNLQYVANARNRSGNRMRIGVGVVVTTDNVGELPELVRHLAEKQVDYIMMTHVVPYSANISDRSLFTTLSRRSIEIIASSSEYEPLLRPDAAQKILAEASGTHDESGIGQAFRDLWNQLASQGYSANLPMLCNSQKKLEQVRQTEKSFAECSRIAREYDLDLRLPNVYPDAAKRVCPYMEKNALFVRSDGKVIPCTDFAYKHESYVNMHGKTVNELIFGDLMREKLMDIWKRKDYETFRYDRKKMVDNMPWCGDCPFSTLGCFFSKTNGRDCYGNEPSCSECLYSAGLSQCNL